MDTRETGTEGWNNHGYWVGIYAEPRIPAIREARVHFARARCGGPGMCKRCGTRVATPWPPNGKHPAP